MNTEEHGFFIKNTPFIVTILVCICAVATIYSNALNAEFIFDDKPQILDNDAIRMETITFDSILASLKSTRPVPLLSFSVNYYFHGYNVHGYHVVNIIIHIINAVLLFFLCRKLLIIAGYKDGWERRWIPVLTACLWAVNPVHIQSVTYIVQRMTSMATMFYVVSFLSYLSARTSTVIKTKRLFFFLSVLSGVLSVLSKEIAITLPFFILLYEWLFFRDTDIRLLKKYIVPIAVFSLFTCISACFYVQIFHANFLTFEYSKYNFDMMERCLTEFRVVIYYLGLLLFPHPSRLNLDYDFPVSHSIIDPFTTLIAILVVSASIAGAIYLIFVGQKGGRPINKLIAFSVLWYFGNLVIESSFIPLDMVFEHRTYLPSILLFLMIIILLGTVLKNRIVLVLATLCCLLVCSYWTFNRNKDWQTMKSIWIDASSKSPEKGRPYFNIGIWYDAEQDPETAYKYYMKTIKKDPECQKAYTNIGMYHFMHGKYDTALGYFNTALALVPNEINASASLGGLFVRMKKYKPALELLSMVLKNDPYHLVAHENMGEYYSQQNEFKKALGHFRFVLEKEPEKAKNYYNYSLVLEKMGQTELAIDYLKKTITRDNNLAEPHIKLGRIYTHNEEYDKAVTHFKSALLIDASSVDCLQHWAFLLLKTGDEEGAVTHFKNILDIDPENMSAFRNIGATLFNGGDTFGSLVNIKKALLIEPDNKETKQYYTSVNNAWKKIPSHERIAQVNKYLDENEKEGLAFAELGKLYYVNGDYDKSIVNWEKVLIIEPENFIAMSNIAVCYMSAEMFADAINIYKKMQLIQPENQIVLYNLACAYSASGELKKSVGALKNAIAKGFTDIEYMIKDPDLSKVMVSDIGRKFLNEFDIK